MDHLGYLILVGIKSHYIFSGHASFQASSSSLHTHVSNTTLSALKGVLLLQHLQWLDGITSLGTPSLATSSPLFVFAAFLLLLRMAFPPPLKLGLLWICRSLPFLLTQNLSNDVRLDALL